MKNKLLIALVLAISCICTFAYAFEKIAPGSYTIAITPKNCEIRTEPTVTKRGICAATMGAGTVTAPLSATNTSIRIGGGWTPATMYYSDPGYSGSGTSMGIRSKTGLLIFGGNGMIEEEMYLPGSSGADIHIVYSIHVWK